MEQAARESGIPLEEVFAYINSRLATVDTVNFQLRLVSQRALEKSMKAFEDLIEEGVRYGGEGSMESVDLKAAQALAKIAMDGIKTAQKGEAPRNKPGDDPGRDLFDIPENPWDLNDIE